MKVVPLLFESSFVFLTITEQSEEEEEEEEEGSSVPRFSGERNSMLTVGYKGDRSYVVRGNNIGVFSHTGDNQVRYFATISKISTTKGKEFKPREVIHYSVSDRNMLISVEGYATRSRHQNDLDEPFRPSRVV